MAAELRELVAEIHELRVLIAAWGDHPDPGLMEVVQQMRRRVREIMLEIARRSGRAEPEPQLLH